MTADTAARDVDVAALRGLYETAVANRNYYAAERKKEAARADNLAAQLAEAEKRNAVLVEQHSRLNGAFVRLNLGMFNMPDGSIDVEMQQFCAENEDFGRVKKALIAAVVYVERQIKGGAKCPFHPDNAAKALTPTANGETATEAVHGPTNTGDGDGR